MSFENLNIKPAIVTALREIGLETPTRIQMEAIPLIQSGEDVIGMSNTGSGKTAAFGVPALERITPGKGAQLLVMAPTRELAAQTSEELRKFGKYLRINIATVFGGVGMGPQIRDMARSEIVVATPGRLLDILQRGNANLKGINCLVLDEADKMVEMGFIEDVESIIRFMPNKKQILLFGATISEEINMLKRKYMHNPKVAKAETYVKDELLAQYYYDVEQHEKFSLLVHLLKTERQGLSLIFCAKRSTVEILAKNLRKQGIKIEMLHGKMSQNKRTSVIDNFKKGKYDALVASSVAARGLDIRALTHVFNYELSRDPQEYIHRIGRTARAGDCGKAITLLSKQDHDTFSSILQHYDVKVQALDKGEFERLRFETGRRYDHGRPRWAPRDQRGFGREQRSYGRRRWN